MYSYSSVNLVVSISLTFRPNQQSLFQITPTYFLHLTLVTLATLVSAPSCAVTFLFRTVSLSAQHQNPGAGSQHQTLFLLY
ncbi:hypothetical protein O6P43_028468 [Quillaja saponaria]|uniref:Uncharacterized protein n=1 Tax=Quillaja saponaria TaxID=32244 RepID=A0AAD7PAA9_QUISA|nr:hypothetical protein O6P43_028468 [Quillaja saponaria]